MERTLIIVKPDGYAKGLTGEIISRCERAGLRVVAIRISQGETAKIDSHYPTDDDWLGSVGQKTLDDYSNNGLSAEQQVGTNDPVAIGQMIRGWLAVYLSSGPIVPIVFEGNRAISVVRKIVGATVPAAASPGTVRGDFSTDSPDAANRESRPIQNLVHASGNAEEAEREIALWFDL